MHSLSSLGNIDLFFQTSVLFLARVALTSYGIQRQPEWLNQYQPSTSPSDLFDAHRLESSFFLCAKYSLTTAKAFSIPAT